MAVFIWSNQHIHRERMAQFNTVPFKQKLLQLVLWNKETIDNRQLLSSNTHSTIQMFFLSNHSPLDIMDGYN